METGLMCIGFLLLSLMIALVLYERYVNKKTVAEIKENYKAYSWVIIIIIYALVLGLALCGDALKEDLSKEWQAYSMVLLSGMFLGFMIHLLVVHSIGTARDPIQKLIEEPVDELRKIISLQRLVHTNSLIYGDKPENIFNFKYFPESKRKLESSIKNKNGIDLYFKGTCVEMEDAEKGVLNCFVDFINDNYVTNFYITAPNLEYGGGKHINPSAYIFISELIRKLGKNTRRKSGKINIHLKFLEYDIYSILFIIGNFRALIAPVIHKELKEEEGLKEAYSWGIVFDSGKDDESHTIKIGEKEIKWNSDIAITTIQHKFDEAMKVGDKEQWEYNFENKELFIVKTLTKNFMKGETLKKSDMDSKLSEFIRELHAKKDRNESMEDVLK